MINRFNVLEIFRIRESFINTIYCPIIPEVTDLYIRIIIYLEIRNSTQCIAK